MFEPLAQSVEHLTFNQGVPRSSRGWLTILSLISSFLAPWSSGLRHRPFTAVTRVRIPVGSPKQRKSSLKGLLFPAALLFCAAQDIILKSGGCSSMVEHQLPKLRVASSILVTRSSKIKPSEDLLNPSEGFLCQVLIVEKKSNNCGRIFLFFVERTNT